MLDPNLENHLAHIENEVTEMRKKTLSTWRIFWHGIVYGAGYVVGAAIIIVVIGWILNIVGVIPALSRQVTEFRTALEKVK